MTANANNINNTKAFSFTAPIVTTPIPEFPHRITMTQFIKYINDGIRSAGIDPDKVYILSIGTGTRTIMGKFGWYYLVNYSEKENDSVENNILIPMYDEGGN